MERQLRKRTPRAARETAAIAAAIATGTDLINVDMTASQTKVMAVLSAEDGLGLMPEEVCKRAGVCVAVYWRMRQDPAFSARHRAILLQHMHGRLGPVIDATVRSALLIGKDGDQARKLIFEACGLVVDKHQHEIIGPPAVAGDMPDATLVWYYLLLRWPIDRWLPGVRLRYEQGQIQPTPPETPVPGLPLQIESTVVASVPLHKDGRSLADGPPPPEVKAG